MTLSAHLFILMICFCRLYLGRHSIDQILLGCIFGYGTAYFCKYCFKPYMYEPIFWPSHDEDPKVVAARSKKAAIYAWLVFLFLCLKVVLLYEYVERQHIIPQQWWDVIVKTCPVWKKSHTFHNFTLVHTGYVGILPLLFHVNYLKHKRWAETGLPPIETSQVVGWKAYSIECVVKAIGFGIIQIATKKLPVIIYGTSNIEPYPGFFKCFLSMIAISILSGPFTQFLRTSLAAPRKIK